MTVAALQRRGWTDHLIRYFVPPPVEDETVSGDATDVNAKAAQSSLVQFANEQKK